TAIEALIAGKRLTELRVGSGSFQRLYTFSDITLEALKEHRDELLGIIAELEPILPRFKSNMTIPLLVSKDRL
ncbi:MAG: hypothetical protein P1T08_18995, partial [Acidimicrobiia bacterium]|nr:hypothetical protein [Acidimicrobiia bacterium]